MGVVGPRPAASPVVSVLRGEVVESAHAVQVAVVSDDVVVARVGDAGLVTFLRSAAKPMQALPLVEDGVADRFGFTTEELALCCASHNSEERHVETARAILAKLGRGETDLACGPHPPIRPQVGLALARVGRAPEAVHSNCSGKHAGMIALAVAHGWPVEGYERPEHPVQRRMSAEIARWTGLAEQDLETGTDGCGVVCFACPLHAMARAFARFAAAAERGEGPARIVDAMTSAPFMVAGTERLCTDLMAATAGRVLAKTGAEGVYCAGVPSLGLGIALKVSDGARRASDVALVHVLERLGVLDAGELERLARYRRPDVRNTRGETTGVIEATFELESP